MKKTEINYPTQEWLDNWVDKYIDKNPNEKITDFKALEEKATEEWWDNLYRRYDTTPEEVEEVESMISQAEVGVFLEHPLFRKLAAADYW